MLCAKLRDNHELLDAQIVMLAAVADETASIRARDAGAAGVLAASAEPSEILATVKRVSAKPPASTESCRWVFVFGNTGSLTTVMLGRAHHHKETEPTAKTMTGATNFFTKTTPSAADAALRLTAIRCKHAENRATCLALFRVQKGRLTARRGRLLVVGEEAKFTFQIQSDEAISALESSSDGAAGS